MTDKIAKKNGPAESPTRARLLTFCWARRAYGCRVTILRVPEIRGWCSGTRIPKHRAFTRRAELARLDRGARDLRGALEVVRAGGMFTPSPSSSSCHHDSQRRANSDWGRQRRSRRRRHMQH